LGILSANANTLDYDFTGSDGDGALDATAQLTLSGDTLTITLNNLEANPTGAGQLISGLTLNATGANGGTLTSSSGVLAEIGSGVLNGGAAVSLPHWGLSVSGGGVSLVETAGNAAQGGSPVDMIIGPDASGNPNSFNPMNYPNANPSITGNHQPSVLGTATFVVTFTGAVTGIDDVTMAFGTGPDFFTPTLPGTPASPVPDGGSTAMLMGSAMLGLGWLRARFARK
jgi:hypothetical protein